MWGDSHLEPQQCSPLLTLDADLEFALTFDADLEFALTRNPMMEFSFKCSPEPTDDLGEDAEDAEEDVIEAILTFPFFFEFFFPMLLFFSFSLDLELRLNPPNMFFTHDEIRIFWLVFVMATKICDSKSWQEEKKIERKFVEAVGILTQRSSAADCQPQKS